MKMKLGVLWSGGKDSAYAAFMAKKENYELSCLISLIPKNKDSYMFHPSKSSDILKQALSMNIPVIFQKTKGKKEIELKDLEKAIKKAKSKYKIKGIVTGAITSVYQATRIQKICDKIGLECFNPLWQKDQSKHLHDLLKDNFKMIITKVSAHGLNNDFVGKKLDKEMRDILLALSKKYHINSAGEGGEYETFVINCPLFRHEITKNKTI